MKKYQRFDVVLPYQSVRHAIEVIPDTEQRTFFATLYACAARPSEINGSQRKGRIHTTTVLPLTWDGIRYNLEDDCIEISTQVAKKRGKVFFRLSQVYLKNEEWLYTILFQYFFVFDEKGVPITRKKEGRVFERISYPTLIDNFNNYFLKECKNIPNTTPYLLRHTRITHYAKLFGFTPEELFQKIKWTDTKMVFVYSHAGDTSDKMKNAILPV